ncbi:MAG: hypothetical protein K6G55_04355 [Selenomonadaceae bacterium]|nr:hypothetical protein [Selenomonadaceae bacterium]
MAGKTINNTLDTVILTGTESEDTIVNSGQKVIMSAYGGNDKVTNKGGNANIDVGAGDDYVENSGDKAYIKTFGGKDSIKTSGFKVTVFAGNEDDSIDNKGKNVSIYGGNGNEQITNGGDSAYIGGNADADSILNNGTNTTIKGDEGNDYIENYGAKVSILGVTGNDIIANSGDNVTIDGGTGTDSIKNLGTKVSINGGTGDDSIYNLEHHVTVTGDDTDTTIKNPSGRDLITNSGSNAVIYGVYGDDTIKNSGQYSDIYGCADKDYILNESNGTYSTLNGGLDDDYIENNAEYVTIHGDNNNDTINNKAAKVYVAGDAGRDSIQNTGDNVSIYGGDNVDSLTNNGKNVYISGDAGNDNILNNGSYVTIYGGDDDDIIENTASNVTINGGDGTDYISNSGTNAYINAGKGNNIVSIVADSKNSTVNLAEGDNTIKIIGTPESFYVEGFDKGNQQIIFDKPISSFETINGGIVVNGTKIFGVEKFEANYTSTNEQGKLTVNFTGKSGASLTSSNTIGYVKLPDSQKDVFTLAGITKSNEIQVKGSDVFAEVDLYEITGDYFSHKGYTLEKNKNYFIKSGVTLNQKIVVPEGATLYILDGANLSGNISQYIENHGTIYMSGGSMQVENNNGATIDNIGGKIYMKGGYVSNNGEKGSAIRNDSNGTVYISGKAHIVGRNKSCNGILNYGNTYVTGGVIESRDKYADGIENHGQLYITGGRFEGIEGYERSDCVNNRSGGVAYISGGNFYSRSNWSTPLLNQEGGILNISGGYFEGVDESDARFALWNREGSTVNITGGTFKAMGWKSSRGTYCLYNDGGTINISNGYFRATSGYRKYGLYNFEGGTANVSGGTFDVYDYQMYGDSSNINILAGNNIQYRDKGKNYGTTTVNNVKINGNEYDTKQFVNYMVNQTSFTMPKPVDDSEFEVSSYAKIASIDGNVVNLYGGSFDTNGASLLANSGDYVFNLSQNAQTKFYGSNSVDTIIANSEITVNPADGNDIINVTKDNVTVEFSKGNDLVTVQDNVKSLNIANFKAGDSITGFKSTGNITTIQSGIAVGNFSIKGAQQGDNTTAWRVNDSIAVYNVNKEVGAALSDDKNSVIYEAEKINRDKITTTGIPKKVKSDGNKLFIKDVLPDDAIELTAANINKYYEEISALGMTVKAHYHLPKGNYYIKSPIALNDTSILIDKDATLYVMDGANISYENDYYAILNNGNFYMAGGSINFSKYKLLLAGALINNNKAYISGGTINVRIDKATSFLDKIKLFMTAKNKGEFWGLLFHGTVFNCIHNNANSDLYISGGVFNSNNGAALYDYGNTYISGGTFNGIVPTLGFVSPVRSTNKVNVYSDSPAKFNDDSSEYITTAKQFTINGQTMDYTAFNNFVVEKTRKTIAEITDDSLKLDNYAFGSAGVTINNNIYGYIVETNQDVKGNLTGNDAPETIISNGYTGKIDAAGGMDKITNTGEYVSITGGANIDTIKNTGRYANISGGADDDYISNTADFAYLNGNEGTDIIYNEGEKVNIDGGAGDDNITNSGEKSDDGGTNAIISGGDGKDIITNSGATVSIHAGNGDDYVTNSGKSALINGYTGYDTIENIGDEVTITGGADNDKIYIGGQNNVIEHRLNGEGGYDTVYGFSNNSTLKITGDFSAQMNSSVYYPTIIGEDVIVHMIDDSTVRLVKAKNVKLNIVTDMEETNTKIIKEITGKDIAQFDKVEITDSQDLPEYDWPENTRVKLNTDLDETLDLSDKDSAQVISLAKGNQEIKFGSQNDVVIVEGNATGEKNIIFTGGDNVGIVNSNEATTNVKLSTGSDSIFVDNNGKVKVDATTAGNALIIARSGSVTVDNYDSDSSVGIMATNVSDISEGIQDEKIVLSGDEIAINSSATVKVNGSEEFTTANLVTSEGKNQKVAFTDKNGGELDISDKSGKFILQGNYDEENSEGTNIVGNKSNNIIFGGSKDTINGGGGKNQIYLTKQRSSEDGATIVLGDNSQNTVNGFGSNDVVQIDDLDDFTYSFNNKKLVLDSGKSKLKFDDVMTDGILLTDGEDTISGFFAHSGDSISVDENNLPTKFLGKKSCLDFSDVNEETYVNLAEGSGTVNGKTFGMSGINKVQAGDGDSTVIGSDSGDTLTAGNGNTNLNGGEGNDVLIGHNDKTGRTTFCFEAGDGNDVIENFEFTTGDNDETADSISVDGDINSAHLSGEDVIVKLDDDAEIKVKDAAGQNILINGLTAKVGRKLSYDGVADNYIGSGTSSLRVDSSVGSAEIWLDNSQATKFYGDIGTVDASNVSGSTKLVGNDSDNKIIAGQGDASLWGGVGNDELIGGEGKNTFFYCNGNGNDIINSNGTNDIVMLADVTLDDLSSSGITDNLVSINFKDGGSLTVDGTTDVTYQLSDGSQYIANRSTGEWQAK